MLSVTVTSHAGVILPGFLFFCATRFRAERRRRTLVHVMEAWRSSVQEARRDHDLDQRREALALRRYFRGWRALRARSTLTPQVHQSTGLLGDEIELDCIESEWQT